MELKMKAFNWVSIFLLVAMLILVPLVHSSRARFPGETTMAEDITLATQDFETKLVKRFGEEGLAISSTSVEDSAREVPTGPDPLHHNENPTGP